MKNDLTPLQLRVNRIYIWCWAGLYACRGLCTPTASASSVSGMQMPWALTACDLSPHLSLHTSAFALVSACCSFHPSSLPGGQGLPCLPSDWPRAALQPSLTPPPTTPHPPSCQGQTVQWRDKRSLLPEESGSELPQRWCESVSRCHYSLLSALQYSMKTQVT